MKRQKNVKEMAHFVEIWKSRRNGVNSYEMLKKRHQKICVFKKYIFKCASVRTLF